MDIMDIRDMLTDECVAECTLGGDNEPACASWVHLIDGQVTRKQALAMLKEVGAWSDYDLRRESEFDLMVKLVWVAAGYEKT